jgi:hypothetical protein
MSRHRNFRKFSVEDEEDCDFDEDEPELTEDDYIDAVLEKGGNFTRDQVLQALELCEFDTASAWTHLQGKTLSGAGSLLCSVLSLQSRPVSSELSALNWLYPCDLSSFAQPSPDDLIEERKAEQSQFPALVSGGLLKNSI